MGILDETRFVERLRFFDGQRLFASDLQGTEAFHREMRWLHNRSLHQAGIGNGFAVNGERDAKEIRIGPGYALDSRGREIVLTHEQVEPIPPVTGEADGQSVFFDLVVSYDEKPETAETRQGICTDRGVIRLREEPVLCFVRLARDENGNLKPDNRDLDKEILAGLRIVLARLEVIDCRLRQTISLSQRRSARPARLPYLACGTDTTEPRIETIINPSVFLLTWHIDTSTARFASTPSYSVRIDGARLGEEDDDGDKDFRFYILDGAPNIRLPKPESFDVEAVVQYFDLTESDPIDTLTTWRVTWMGVE